MKTIVIIIIPTPRLPASSVNELLAHIAEGLRGVRDARLRQVARAVARDRVCPDQLWTWFLPNPL